MSESDRNMLEQIERGERWLAGISTPGPSADVIARVKGAVGRELARGQKPAAHQWRWPAGLGAIATAAAITLAVWVGWQSSKPTSVSNNPPIIAKNSMTPRISPVIREQEVSNAS